jgi:hypothetical protein
VVFYELSLSLLLITIVPNSNVSLLGVSTSMSRRGLPLLLILDLSFEVVVVFLVELPPELNIWRLLVLLVADCLRSPRLCSDVGSDYCGIVCMSCCC